MKLTFVPLVVSLLPFAAIHISYLLAASFGHVPWCIPYIDSCTSISATGREGLAGVVFRATVIPSGALMLVYWRLVGEWLRALDDRNGTARRTMVAFGLIAGVGLILYASALGEIGDHYEFQRRLGVRLFFGFTVLAQLLLALQVRALARARAQPSLDLIRTARVLLALSAATFAIGLASLPAWALFERFDDYENALAWWVTLLVLLHPLVTYAAWKDSGFEARFRVLGR